MIVAIFNCDALSCEQVAFDFILRIAVIEVGKASQWIEKPVSAADAEAARVAGEIQGTHRGKHVTAKAFAGILRNLRAWVSLAISLALGVYMGGTLDAAMTLRLNQVRRV